MPLTARDHELLAYCGQYKAAPLSVLAARFFATNPVTGAANKDPQHACRRRLAELAKEGFIRPGVDRGPRSLAVLSARGARALGIAAPRSVAANARAHHIATLEAIERLRSDYAQHGVSLENVRLEFQLRAQEQQGKRTRRGETFESFPDATFDLVRTSNEGARYVEEVAFEYVTNKYSDADIIEKHQSFKRFDNVVWLSDRQSTARRVGVLTGRPSLVHEEGGA